MHLSACGFYGIPNTDFSWRLRVGQYILNTRESVPWGYRYPDTEKLTLNKRRAAEGLIVFSPLRSIWIPDEKKKIGVFDVTSQNESVSRTRFTKTPR